MAESASICLFAGREEKIQLKNRHKQEIEREFKHVCVYKCTYIYLILLEIHTDADRLQPLGCFYVLLFFKSAAEGGESETRELTVTQGA